MTYNELNIGDSAFFEKTISETDVYSFAGITGDFNPAHINKTHAENSRFGQRIAHGMLSGSLFSTVIGMKLPGEGTIYLGQTLEFKAPVYFGDTIKASVTISEKLEKGRVKLKCSAINQDGTVVIEGEALVLPPRE